MLGAFLNALGALGLAPDQLELLALQCEPLGLLRQLSGLVRADLPRISIARSRFSSLMELPFSAKDRADSPSQSVEAHSARSTSGSLIVGSPGGGWADRNVNASGPGPRACSSASRSFASSTVGR